MTPDKLTFLQEIFPSLLKQLKGDEKPLWGKMNPQQMIEHMNDSFRQASEKGEVKIATPTEKLPAFKSFLLSDKEFRPNTKNQLLNEEPVATVNKGIQPAISELELSISDFITFFEGQTGKTTTNPIFGDLNFEEWVQLLHKHAVHHLKQFGLL